MKNKINDKNNVQESETEVCFSFHSNTIDAENIDNVQSLRTLLLQRFIIEFLGDKVSVRERQIFGAESRIKVSKYN